LNTAVVEKDDTQAPASTCKLQLPYWCYKSRSSLRPFNLWI